MRVHPINENIEDGVIQTAQLREMNREITPGNPEEDMITESDSEIDYDNLCIICLENFMHMQISLPCNHIFHISCIIKWVYYQTREKQTTRCPICKIPYDFKEFANKIFVIYITCINASINKLDLLLIAGTISRSQKKYIIKLKKEYKDALNLFKNINDSSIPGLLQYEIMPLPEDVINLVHRTELQIATAKNECTDNLLPSKHLLTKCKIYILLKQNAIVKCFLNIIKPS